MKAGITKKRKMVEHQKKGILFKPFFLEIKYRNVKTLNITTAHRLLSKRYRYEYENIFEKYQDLFYNLKKKI